MGEANVPTKRVRSAVLKPRARLLGASVALATLALLVAADRAPRPGRVAAPRASAAPLDPRLPDFTLFGWVSPPVESTSSERLAEYAGAGLNVAIPAWGDSGRGEDNLRRMAWAAEHGVRCIAWDRRLYGVRFDDPKDLAPLDSVAADYRDRPGFLAYYFEDEPPAENFPELARFHAALRERDPAHISFNNLLGRYAFATRAAWEAYVRDYVEQVRPAVLCDDQYDFLRTGDRGMFVENAAALAAIAREHGLPFWIIVQLIEHGPYRALVPGELRWQVAMSLAYGARGIGYFTYWTPAPDPQWNWQYGVIGWDGRRTHWHDLLAAFNPRVDAAGRTLARAAWLATEHTGSVPAGGTGFAPDDWVAGVEGRAALGSFAAASGERYLLVANADSTSAREVVLRFGNVTGAARLGSVPDQWTPLALEHRPNGPRLALALEAGDFALLRLEGGAGSVASGHAPVMSLGPVPARGRLGLGIRGLSNGARLEILDAAGRRVWSRPLPRGAAALEWRGERDGGGEALAGVYFARVEDDRGVAATRFVWLGR